MRWRLKIGAIIVGSYILSHVLTFALFEPDSPRLRPLSFASLTDGFTTSSSYIASAFTSPFSPSSITPTGGGTQPTDIPLQSIPTTTPPQGSTAAEVITPGGRVSPTTSSLIETSTPTLPQEPLGSVTPTAPTVRNITPQATTKPATPSPQTTLTSTPTSPPRSISTPTPTVVSQKTLSKSKLSIFVLASVTSGTQAIIDSCPRVLKVIDPGSTHLELVKKYKQTCPGGITVLRFYHPQGSLQAWDTDIPEEYAIKYFNTIDSPKFQALGAYKSYFDYITGPNEFEDLPYPWKMPSEPDTSKAAARSLWNGKFWWKLAQLEATLGLKLCALSNPPNTLGATELGPMIPYLRNIKQAGGALCYHDYDPSKAGNNYYRTYYSYFASAGANDLTNMPLIIGEAGIASNSRCGYQCASTAEIFKQRLSEYDATLRADSYVIGATLFQIGNSSDWSSFDVEPIAPWLTQHLKDAR